MTDHTCPRDGQPISDEGVICWGCTNKLQGLLDDVPATLDELETTRIRLAQVASVAGYQTTICSHAITDDCDCGVNLPWSERAANLADGLRDAITMWCRTYQPTALTLLKPRHIPEWLASNVDQIRMRDWAPDMLADLAPRIAAARTAIDRPADRLYAGRCGITTNRIAVAAGHAPIPCRFELWATIGLDTITCPGCQWKHNVTDVREKMLDAAANNLYTAKTCALALTTVEIPVTMELISKWGHRLVRGVPKLPIAGYTPDGKPLYRLGDVRDVARGITPGSRQTAQLSSTV